MTQKFVKYAAVSRNIDNINAWFRLCQINGTPYVIIKTRMKYADVRWDHINFLPEIDNYIDKIGQSFVDGFILIFKKYANKKSEYIVGGRVAEFKNIDIELVESMASEIYDYILEKLCLTESKNKHV